MFCVVCDVMTARLSLLPSLLAAVFVFCCSVEAWKEFWHFHSRHKDRRMPSCLMISSFSFHPPPRRLGLLIYVISWAKGMRATLWALEREISCAKLFQEIVDRMKNIYKFSRWKFSKTIFVFFARALPRQITFWRNIYFEPDLFSLGRIRHRARWEFSIKNSVKLLQSSSLLLLLKTRRSWVNVFWKIDGFQFHARNTGSDL